jgi:hypothetical protein
MSSPEEFFDILYLGIFVILSPAFDARFYNAKPPPTLIKEAAYAASHFHYILRIFSERFIILLENEPIAHSYVVNRMLGEFAAAAAVFSKGIREAQGEGEGDEEEKITSFMFLKRLEGILEGSYPEVFPYYSHCFSRGHKHFLWTGPKVQILQRSEALNSIIPFSTAGESLDLPSHEIYGHPLAGKRHIPGESLDIADQQPKKRRR